MNSFLVVEQYNTWLRSRNSNFSLLAFSYWHTVAKEIKVGDELIYYVASGRSKFSGVRKVVSEMSHRPPIESPYLGSHAYYFKTEPMLQLDVGDWVHIST